MRSLFLLLILCFQLQATTYYVSPSGNNGNSGTDLAHPWLTVTFAQSHVAAGDVVRVQSGTYEERVTFSVDGTVSNPLTFIGEGNPVIRGFTMDNRSYIKVIGFVVTHVNTTYAGSDTFSMLNASNCMVIDNTITNVAVAHAGILMAPQSGVLIERGCSNIIRGNLVGWIGWVNGVNTNALQMFIIGGNWNVIEYNRQMGFSDDFLDLFGIGNIVRNNYLQGNDDNLYVANQGIKTPHIDAMQSDDSSTVTNLQNVLYECNLMYSNNVSNGHFWLSQNTGNNTNHGPMQNFIVRRNVTFTTGEASFCGYDSCANAYTYNNSCISNHLDGFACNYVGTNFDSPLFNSTNCNFVNNLYDSACEPNGSPAVYNLDNAGVTNTSTIRKNLIWEMGTKISFTQGGDITNQNPLFTSPLGVDFHLGNGSPAIGTGTNMTTTSSSGSTTVTIPVNDAQWFFDGWGLVQGDSIIVGANSAVTVTNADWANKQLKVSTAITFNSGDNVYLANTSDIGAYPNGSTFLTAATLTQQGQTYTVSTTGSTRGVWFYLNGIPDTFVTSAPYQTNYSSGTITAKAYALYAQATPVITATIAGGNNHSVISGKHTFSGKNVIQ